MRQFLIVLLSILFLLSSSGCGAGQVLGPTLTPTLTSTATPTLTPTATSTPTPTPIPTPSAEVGLRPENAATQVYENGIWVVKNADGKTTATWNTVTEQWDYLKENIQVEQIIVGNTVDRSLIEPYLGPLPLDDPLTHFIDPETGERVEYGLGPETIVPTRTADGTPYENSARLVFARFRGVIPVPESYISTSAIIFEIPKNADTSIIFVTTYRTKSFSVVAVVGDVVAGFDTATKIGSNSWFQEAGIASANKYLIGKMMIVETVYDWKSPNPDNEEEDKNSRAFLDYIAGITTDIPEFSYDARWGARPPFLIPESQAPPR